MADNDAKIKSAKEEEEEEKKRRKGDLHVHMCLLFTHCKMNKLLLKYQGVDGNVMFENEGYEGDLWAFFLSRGCGE